MATNRPTIGWSPEQRAALGAYAAAHETTIADLIRDALREVGENPERAVRVAGPRMGNPEGARRYPLDGAVDRELWDAAAAKLAVTFGGAVGVGPAVRGLLLVRVDTSCAS